MAAGAFVTRARALVLDFRLETVDVATGGCLATEAKRETNRELVYLKPTLLSKH